MTFCPHKQTYFLLPMAICPISVFPYTAKSQRKLRHSLLNWPINNTFRQRIHPLQIQGTQSVLDQQKKGTERESPGRTHQVQIKTQPSQSHSALCIWDCLLRILQNFSVNFTFIFPLTVLSSFNSLTDGEKRIHWLAGFKILPHLDNVGK